MLSRYPFICGLLAALFLGAATPGHAQTALSAGQVVFTGVNMSEDDAFTFAPLVDLDPGTQIRFTDNGWLASGGFRSGEGVVVYTAPGTVLRGTLVHYNAKNTSPEFSVQGDFELDPDNDQVLAYQLNDSESQTFLAALSSTDWSDATSANTSALPTGLTVGTSAVVVPVVNAYMSQIAQRRGPAGRLRVWFATGGSWTGDSSVRQQWETTAPFGDNLIVEDGVVPDAEERQALYDLYAGTNGPEWSGHDHWPGATDVDSWPETLTSADWATWFGVSVSDGDITGLDLRANGLSGPVPPTLGLLTQLRTLRLDDNALTGPLPAELGQLTELQVLDLSKNQLTGPLPTAVAGWGQLQYLSLTFNRLAGYLPAELGQCRQLLSLGLSGNRFSGPLPASLGRLANLTALLLDDNRFAGPLPDSLARLSALSVLVLSYNQFSGAIPSGWAQLQALTALRLDYNRLTGPFPASLTALPNLYALGVAHNALSGTIPAVTGTTGGGLLDFSANEFTALASYAGVPNRGNKSLVVSGNRLDFGQLEPFFSGPGQHAFAAFQYANQRPETPADTVHYLYGGSVQAHRTPTGAHNNPPQWERQVGGAWVEVPGATGPDLYLPGASEAAQGQYRLRVTNAWVPGLTWYSRAVYADWMPYQPLPENRPVEATQPALATGFEPATRSNAAGGVINYVRTYAPRVALYDSARTARTGADSVQVSSSYLDGLGRAVQTVQHRAAPGGLDVVQPTAYDAVGRQPRQYLPYAATSVPNALGYRADARHEQYVFYRTAPAAAAGVARTGVPFGETAFEASPLNRPLLQAAPGESWQAATGHVVSHAERLNTGLDSVQRFRPGAGNSPDLGWQADGYAAGELWGSQTTDEHGYRTLEWKDRLGQLVLKQVEANRLKNYKLQTFNRWLRTYYVYDDLGRLRAVLPPAAVRALQAQGWAVTAAAEQLLFRYRYDGRGRVLAKRVPGQDGETQLVYNRLDQPVLTQDAAQRGRNEWAYTKYDGLGRVVLTGLVRRSVNNAQPTLQAEADAVALQNEQRSGNGSAYPQYYTTDQAYPRLGQQGFGPGEVLTVNYYDDYNFDNDVQGTADAAYDTQADAQLSPAPVPDARVTGLVTRTRVRVLGLAATAPNAWLTTTTFYDERARPVQVQHTNARGGQDVVTSQLDYPGQVVKSVARHHGPGLPAAGIAVTETMTYDRTGRLLTTRQQLPGEAQPAPVAALAYNALGQLTRKTLGAGALTQQVDYRYNIRGWLTGLNDAALSEPGDLFGLELSYEQGFTASYAQYNGNLTGQKWRSRRDQTERAYGYAYDPLNRLLQGDYVARAGTSTTAPWTAEAGRHRLYSMSYDDNGNIRTLRRRGLLAAASRNAPAQYGLVDVLSYAYDGNRLRAVEDQVSTNQLPRPAGYHGAPASLAGDFQEQGVHQGQEYFYDANGSLTQDLNKGITGIAYNHLSLPTQIRFGTGADSLVFRYTAAGQKVAKLVYQSGRPVQRTDYLGPYQYEQDSLRFFPHAEGRVLRTVSSTSGAATYEREFTLKDHLGNLRLAYRRGRVLTYAAGLEPGDATRETAQFDPPGVSAPVAQYVGGLARTGQYVGRLNAGGTAPQPLGPLKQLAVQKGDTVTLTAPGYYPQSVQNTGFAFSLASFVASLLQQPPPPPVGADGRGRTQPLPLLSLGVSAALPALLPVSQGVPQGYVRLLVFDADSTLLTSRTQQLSLDARNGYEPLQVRVIAPADGYVTAYVGNESNADVFFDDVSLELRQGLQVQENQYDPWGLSLIGLDYAPLETLQQNKNQFNGKEQERELGLNWQDFNWRHYDPATARFFGVDRLADKFVYMTDYQFASNNPASKIELDGLEGVDSKSLSKASEPSGMVMTTSFNCHYEGQTGLQPMQGRPTPRRDAFFNGMANLTFGIIGSAGAIGALPETGGYSSLALTHTVGEIGIGAAQVMDALTSPKFDENSVLQQSSSLLGLAMYGSGNKYAPYGDALGQFIPGMMSGGNIPGIVSGIGETVNSARQGKVGLTLYQGLSVTDGWLDSTGLRDAAMAAPNGQPASSPLYLNLGGSNNTANQTKSNSQSTQLSIQEDAKLRNYADTWLTPLK